MKSSQHKWLLTKLLFAAHWSVLLVILAYIFLAWDSGRIIQRAVERESVPVYSINVYKAVYGHYFPRTSAPDWSALSMFIGVSNVLHLYSIAPAILILTTYLLRFQFSARRRWLLLGSSLITCSLLLWLAPNLRALSVILD